MGCYLLISLFFVLATMIEFAVVVIMKRRLEWNTKGNTKRPFHSTAHHKFYRKPSCLRKRKIIQLDEIQMEMQELKNLNSELSGTNGNKCRCIGSNSMMSSLTETIDFISFLTFSASYFLFNCVFYAKNIWRYMLYPSSEFPHGTQKSQAQKCCKFMIWIENKSL